MELYGNISNRMTRFLVSSGALTTPFVLVDVGVQGGISGRWSALQDHLTVYGFDLLHEAVAPLQRQKTAARHYFTIGLADRDGELDIVVPPNRYETNISGAGQGERRRVQLRRLDTLFAQGLIPAADFIKLDCEGYEPVVLRGAANFLTASNLVGADVESNFNLSPVIPRTHFYECCEPLVPQRLMVFDIQFNRWPALRVPWLASPGLYRPATLNVLFARHLPQERDSAASYQFRPAEQPVDPQTVLKSAIVFEAYGLADWAKFVLQTFAGELGASIDVDKAINELLRRPGIFELQRRIKWRLGFR